jgi:membrane-associated phospholipid phosphatase
MTKKLALGVVFVLTLTGVSRADDKRNPLASSIENEASAEARIPPFLMPLDLYGDLATDLDIDIEDFLTLDTKGKDQQQPEPTEDPTDPGFNNFGRAIGYNFTKGLFAKDNLKPFVVGSLATLAMIPVDDEVSDYFQGKSEELGDAGQFIGYLGVAATTGGVLLATPFVKSGKYRAFSFSLAQSMILNNALVFSLKYAVGRTRPNEESDVSFPSGHTSNTVALATVVDHYYGKKWGIPLYIVAGLVGLSRIEKGKHFPSDVVFGATLGYVAARAAIRGSEHYASKRKWTLMPSVGRRHAAVYFYLEF